MQIRWNGRSSRAREIGQIVHLLSSYITECRNSLEQEFNLAEIKFR